MNTKMYVGDLNGGSLLIAETRIIAKLLLDKPSEQAWKQLIVDDNVLQKKSAQTSLRFANVIRKRLQTMGEPFIHGLLNVSETAYVQLLLAAFMVQSPIVIDFMRECLAENKRLYLPTLSKNAWADFIVERLHTMPDLENYAESTQKKMGNNIIKALVDSGYLDSSHRRTLQAVYVCPEVIDILVQVNRTELIQSMECTQ